MFWQPIDLFSCMLWLKESKAGGRKRLAHEKNREMWFLGRTLVCTSTRFSYLIDTSVLWAQLFTSPSTTNMKSSRKPLTMFFCVSHLHSFSRDICHEYEMCSPVSRAMALCDVQHFILLQVCFCSARDTVLNWAKSNKEPIKEIIYPFPRHIHESNLSSPSSTQSQDMALICLVKQTRVERVAL